MAYSLEHFDLHYSPDLVGAGEQLYDKGAVVNIEEIEKNLWSFEVKDGQTYEVEILISPKKVINTSCECITYKMEAQCKHIVACLFQLRFIKTKPIADGPRVMRNVPKKLSIPNILNQVSGDELKSFIRTYAKKNKKFSTALKATFARRVEIEDNQEKYESILNSIIRPATEVNHKVSYQSIKQFITISGQFDAQFEDALSLKQYKEAFYIIKSLLAKVAYVNHWTASENEDILRLTKHFHKQFRLLMESQIAPSLLEDLINFGIELSSRSYYHVTHSEHNLMLILLDPPDLATRQDELIALLENKLRSSFLHDNELEKLWIVRQYYIEKKIALKVAKQPILSSQSVYRIVERLKEFQAYDGLRNFLEMFVSNGKINDQYLAKIYMEVLSKVGSKREITELTLHSLIFFKDIYYYEIFKQYFPEEKEEFFENISEKIKGKRSFDYQKLYLDILSSDEKTDELIDYLLASIYPIRHIYDRADFIKRNSDNLSDVLINLSDRYLSEYLGQESSNEMKKLLVFLKRNQWLKEKDKLQRHLLQGYEDRKSLQIEIQDF